MASKIVKTVGTLRRRRTPMAELSWPRRAKRVGGLVLFVSSLAMGVSAATASTDWNIKASDAA